MMISVTITTRNRSALLREAIESVLQQEPCGEQVEVVVIDDDSTDETPAVVSAYPSVRYVRTRQGSCAGSRNAGVEAARGDWIAILDDDDVWLPSKLRKSVEVIRANPEARLVFTAAIFCDHQLRHLGVFKGPDTSNQPTPIDLFLDGRLPINSTLMLHRELFDNLGKYDASLARSEDRDFWFRALSNGVKCASTPEALVLYRLHPSRSGKNDPTWIRRSFADHMKVLQRHTAPGSPLRPPWISRQRVLWRMRGWHAYHLMRAARRAAKGGQQTMAWRLRRAAVAMSPVHAIKNWLVRV